MTVDRTLRRRWFRFSLRTLLVVMAVIAVATGWFVRHQRHVAEQRTARYAIEEGGNFHFRYPWHRNSSGGPRFVPEWIASRINSDHFGDVVAIEFGFSPNLEKIEPHMRVLGNLDTVALPTEYVSDETANAFAVRFPHLKIIRGFLQSAPD